MYPFVKLQPKFTILFLWDFIVTFFFNSEVILVSNKYIRPILDISGYFHYTYTENGKIRIKFSDNTEDGF